MHKTRGLVTSALLALMATTSPAAMQQDQQPPTVPTFRGMIDAVRVDVIVTDEGGRPITDLTRDDFALTEDGKPQAVESFEAVRIDVQPRAADAAYVPKIRSIDDEEREARHDDVRLFVIYSASAVHRASRPPRASSNRSSSSWNRCRRRTWWPWSTTGRCSRR